MTPEQIKQMMLGLKKLVAIGEVLAPLTPTDLDDKAVATAKVVVSAIEPFVDEPWFHTLVNFIAGLLKAEDKQAAMAAMQAAMPE